MSMWIAGLGATATALSLLWVRRRLLRVEIIGRSMNPTFAPGDKVFARRVGLSQLRTGDVVVVEGVPTTRESLTAYRDSRVTSYQVVERNDTFIGLTPATAHWVIKRVAALPGEPVPESVREVIHDDVVPSGSLVVLGDNLDHSMDSRHYGYIPEANVLGRVVGRRAG